jgi:Tol biopolymer transport system component
MLGQPSGVWLVSAVTGAIQRVKTDAWGAAISPDGSRIAYLNGSRTEVWLMGADGQQPAKIIPATAGDRFTDIAWSPDSKRIAVLRQRPARDEARIDTCDLEGHNQVIALSDPRLRAFCWSADGRIIFSAIDAPGDFSSMNLWEVRTDTLGRASRTPRRITMMAGFAFAHPSTSLDGKRLAFLRARYDSDVYLGDIGPESKLRNVRRLTLSERIDWPGSWTSDSRKLLFHSDRDGALDIFQQSIDQPGAEAIVRGPEEKTLPQISPDGAWVLYRAWPAKSAANSVQILRRALVGGATEVVLESGGYPGPVPYTIERSPFNRRDYPGFRCVASGTCVLMEATLDQLIFYRFDPNGGPKRELVRIGNDPLETQIWDLSPDGTQVAVATRNATKGSIKVVPLENGTPSEIIVKDWNYLDGLAWAPDGRAFFLSSWSPLGSTIIRVTLSGETHPMYQSSTWIPRVIPSPDGRHLSFGMIIYDSNAWLIER